MITVRPVHHRSLHASKAHHFVNHPAGVICDGQGCLDLLTVGQLTHGSAAIEQTYALRTVFNLQEHLNNKAVLQDASACDIHSSFHGNNRFDRDLVQEDPLALQPNCLSMSGPEATQQAWAQHSGHAGYAPDLTQYPSFALPQVSQSTWSMGGAATFSQPPGLSYLNQYSPSNHYASMPSPAFLQHGPTQAYHRALVAASQPYPSPSWHSSPSTSWHTHAAASGSLTAATPMRTPVSAPGCPPAAALGQLPATAPEQVLTIDPLHSSEAASEQPHVSASELPYVSACELPHVSASQALPAQSHLLQKSAPAASPHLPPASGTMDLGQHAQTHMQAKLAQQQAAQASPQMPTDLGQHAHTHTQAKLAQQQAVQASTQMPTDLGQHARTHMQAQLAQQQASAQVPGAAAAVSQAVEVSAMQADPDAGQPQLPTQRADSAQFKMFSLVKPAPSAGTTREPIRAFQPPLPLGLPAALASGAEEGTTTTGATASVRPQAGQQVQQLHDRPVVPKLQPRAVTLARQTSLAGSAEALLQTPAPVNNQLDAQRDILSILFPTPTPTPTREAPEQLSQPAMLASVQQQDDKPSSQQFAEEPADVPMQELAQLLLLKRKELSQKPLQKLPQAHQQLQGRCQEQPQGLLQANPQEQSLTQPHGQLHLSAKGQYKEGRKQPAADVSGDSALMTPAFAVAGRQDSVKAEADTELLHSSSGFCLWCCCCCFCRFCSCGLYLCFQQKQHSFDLQGKNLNLGNFTWTARHRHHESLWEL